MLTLLSSIGTFLVKLLLLIFVLGIIILVHEFGHFICAKFFKVYIYEFSIGMGPIIFSKKGKDNISYNIRAIPIGGFVSMAGEVYDDDDKIPKESLMCNKPWYQRLIILVAGVFNNFVLAILLLFIYALFFPTSSVKPVINEVSENSAAQESGIKSGDEILYINDYRVSSWDKAQIILYYKTNSDAYTFKVKHQDNSIEEIQITPKTVVNDDETESKVFGIAVANSEKLSFFNALKYGFQKFASTVDSMIYTLWGLISGKISLNALSGPVGIYEVVGSSIGYTFKVAVSYIIYIIAYLSINVGVINILPFPAFDGGHVLFILIEAIKGSKVNAKFENICHIIGFILIFLLMIIITISDIIKLI